jgi:segregation and condensation protein B
MNIDAQIEAILFFKAEPMKTMRLAEILDVDEETIRQGLATLSEKLSGRGVALLLKDDEVSLGTIAEMGETIEKMIKDELHRDLGNAAIETLTIVLYKGPIQKSEIDFIRGVNSNFILRNLLVRGLVEKIPNPTDQRSFLYRPTFDLLAYLGINRTEDLPEFEEFRMKVEESIEQFSHKDEKEELPENSEGVSFSDSEEKEGLPPTDPELELSSVKGQEEEAEFLDSSSEEQNEVTG